MATVELIAAAGTPMARIASTWSFINASNGETTSVRPSVLRSAGAW
ncbi:hypothetical protein [Candidatus Amarobacter glycogenicus]